MCLLIHKPAEAQLDPDMLNKAACIHSDGWGIALIRAPGDTKIARGLDWKADRIKQDSTTTQEFMGKSGLEIVEANQATEMVVHFRASSSGKVTLDNVHPIVAGPNLLIAHNGHISNFAVANSEFSDTKNLARWLGTFNPAADETWDNDLFWSGIKAFLTSWNKLIFINVSRGEVKFINKQQGWDLKSGVWVSNKSYEDKWRYYSGGCYGWPMDDDDVVDVTHTTIHKRTRLDERYKPHKPSKRSLCDMCGSCGCQDCETSNRVLLCHKEGELDSEGKQKVMVPNDRHSVMCPLSTRHAGMCTGLKVMVLKFKDKLICEDCSEEIDRGAQLPH